jgi:hypothetical protein
MESIFISTNGNYFVTNEIMYSVYEDKSYKLDEISLEKFIDVFAENTQFSLKNRIHEIKELAAYQRRITYQLMEGLSHITKTELMMEYEYKFGGLLLTENYALLENWFGDAWDWTKKAVVGAGKAVVDGAKWVGGKVVDGIKWGWDKLKAFGEFAIKTGKDLVACISGKGCSPFFEDYREMLFNPVSIAVETFLSATGIGTAVPMVLWGIMLAWDLYLLATDYKNFSWLNLILDILGVGLGAIAKGFRALLGGERAIANTAGKELPAIIQWGEKIPGVKQVFTKISGVLKSSLGAISSGLKSAGTFLSEKLGLKWVGKIVDSFSSKAAQLMDSLGVKAGKDAQKKFAQGASGKFQSAQLRNTAAIKSGLKSGVKHGAIAGGIMSGAESETGQKMIAKAGGAVGSILGTNKGAAEAGVDASKALASNAGFTAGIDY